MYTSPCIPPRADTRGYSQTGRDTSSSPSIPRKKEKKSGDSENTREEERVAAGARERDRFDEESERARAASKPYTRRSKENSVLSATMVTKRTGRSHSLEASSACGPYPVSRLPSSRPSVRPSAVCPVVLVRLYIARETCALARVHTARLIALN